jgi:hypothetical protein
MVNSYSVMELPVEFRSAPPRLPPLPVQVDRDLNADQNTAAGRTARPGAVSMEPTF